MGYSHCILGPMSEKFTGFHSTIHEVHLPSLNDQNQRNFLEKRYGPKAQGFELNQATSIVQHMRTFASLASEIGIPVVQATGHVIYNNGHINKVDLAEYVPNVGPNLLQIIENEAISGDMNSASHYFDRYLHLFQQSWNADFRISLDPPLTNFCVDHHNSLWYVDCMPPRQKLLDGTYISEWPVPPDNNQAFIVDRYFSPHQARIIYAQALRNLLDIGFTSAQIKKSICSVLGTDAQNAIAIPDSERKRLLAEPTPTDVDLLRIVASEEYGNKNLNKDEMKEVYKLCHVGIGGILPTGEEVKTASRLLQYI